MTLIFGILLALVCSLATNLGFLYKHRGACAAPCVDIRRPLKSGRALFASKWFALGMAVATGAWVFHVAALAFAPMALVQAVPSGGVVLPDGYLRAVYALIHEFSAARYFPPGAPLLVVANAAAVAVSSPNEHKIGQST